MTASALPPVELIIASGTSYFGVPACPSIPGLHGTGLKVDGRRILFATSAGMVPGEGGSMAERVRALSPGGRLANLGDSAGPHVWVPSALMRSRSLDLLGFTTVTLGWSG